MVCFFKNSKKKYDRVRSSYENSLVQLKSVSKKQKINLNKVLEAELKKDTYEEAFEAISQETTFLLSSVKEKNDYLNLDSLCFYYEAYLSYFGNAYEYLKDLKAEVARTKQIVAEVQIITNNSLLVFYFVLTILNGFLFFF
jgi:3-methyladenine DNA glycosylase AlkD